MNTQDIRIFLAAFQSHSFSKAGEEFFITPQGVSRVIRRLEDELVCNLFIRTRQGVTPTREAELLAEAGERMIIEEETLKKKIVDPSYTPGNDLHVAFATGLLSYLRPEYWDGFTREYPDVNLFFTEYDDIETAMAVQNGDAEVGLLSEPVDYSVFDAFLFDRVEAFAVMNADHPLAGRETISYRDFDGRSICIMGPQYTSYNLHMNNLANAGSHPEEIYLIRDTGDRRDAADYRNDTESEGQYLPEAVLPGLCHRRIYRSACRSAGL